MADIVGTNEGSPIIGVCCLALSDFTKAFHGVYTAISSKSKQGYAPIAHL